jgi:hypothetical protein
MASVTHKIAVNNVMAAVQAMAWVWPAHMAKKNQSKVANMLAQPRKKVFLRSMWLRY